MKREKVIAKGTSFFIFVLVTANVLAIPERAEASSDQANAATTPGSKITAPITATKPSSVNQFAIPAKKPLPAGAPTQYRPNPMSGRAKLYYDLVWGVDSLKLRYAESGEMIRFSYRVLDPQKAKSLNDKKNEPSLIDPRARVKLTVPSMEKVGKLRQSSPPQAGRMYWMAFSNKGRLVRPGDRVNVVVGNFQANGLVVE